MLTILALIGLIVWLWLVLGHDRFWLTDQRLASTPASLPVPEVVVLVPARNEAATVESVLRSLCAQRYPARLQILCIDDASDDGTSEIIARMASEDDRVRAIQGRPLPAGWTGKLWALQTGYEQIAACAPSARWVWLSDADIVHGPDTLARLFATAEATKASLVSVFARLHTGTAAERFLVPAFAYFFKLLYPFRAVNHAGRSTAAAAGGSILIDRQVLDHLYGFVAIKGDLIDDVALAKAVKATGRPIRLILDPDTQSIRPYGFWAFWRMVRRTAFVELRFSALRLAIAILGLALVFLTPVIASIQGAASGDVVLALAGAAAWGLMSASFVPILRYYGLRPWRAPFLPLAASVYMAMTLDSARVHWLRTGSHWRGRNYTQADLKLPHR